MNTEEAIKFIEDELKTYKEILESIGMPEMKKEKEDIKNAMANYKSIIELLQRGKKYKKYNKMFKKMWGEFKEIFGNGTMENEFGGRLGPINYIMDNYEQKYFPKGGWLNE